MTGANQVEDLLRTEEGIRQLEEQYGVDWSVQLPPLLKTNLAKIKKHVLDEAQDWVIVIEGRVGSGKSTLASRIVRFIDDRFTVYFQAVYDIIQWLRWYDTFQNEMGRAILFDEGKFLFYKRDAMTLENKSATEIFDSHRDRCVIYVICIPKAVDLDKYFKEGHVIKTLIRVHYDIVKGRRHYDYLNANEARRYMNGGPPNASFSETFTIESADPLKTELDRKKREWQDIHRALIYRNVLRKRGIAQGEGGV